PALLEKEGKQSLVDYLKTQTLELMGARVAGKFQSLPYLLKILDVRQMLSIQVHPSKESAAAGFRNEDQQDIPIKASHRNYKDENHKPELMVALSDFWLLHGFKSADKLRQVLSTVPELN